jgi:hypothetical protein
VYVLEEEESSGLAVKPTVKTIQCSYCKFYSCSCAINEKNISTLFLLECGVFFLLKINKHKFFLGC